MRIIKYDTRLDEDRLPMLIKEASINYHTVGKLTNPAEIVKFLNDTEDYENLTNEVLFVMCFNTKMKLIGTFITSKGTVDHALASMRDIFMRALALGATKIIVIHNHPSGDPTFSETDMCTARRIKEAGTLLEIPMLDFIATGENGTYRSYQEIQKQ